MWAAYTNGRAENDPTENWYKGEIGFFDGYIIPLATKLKDCGVFGSAGDEYLGNALRNKAEWIEKGQLIVEGKNYAPFVHYVHFLKVRSGTITYLIVVTFSVSHRIISSLHPSPTEFEAKIKRKSISERSKSIVSERSSESTRSLLSTTDDS
jgi:hypothetical protein